MWRRRAALGISQPGPKGSLSGLLSTRLRILCERKARAGGGGTGKFVVLLMQSTGSNPMSRQSSIKLATTARAKHKHVCRTQAPGPGRPPGGLPSGVWYTPAAAPLPAGAGEEARGPLDSGSPSPRLSQPAAGRPVIVDSAARTGTITFGDRTGSPAYFC